MKHEVKDYPVAELMRLVDEYVDALDGWSSQKMGEARAAVVACARKLVDAREPLTWPPIVDPAGPPAEVMAEQPCFCNGDISLQSVAGGAHPTGLYGTVWLRIGGQVVEYTRKSSSPAVVSGGPKPANTEKLAELANQEARAEMVALQRGLNAHLGLKAPTDTEMLDWMQFHGAHVAWGNDSEVCNVRWADRDGRYETALFNDWREAIVAAMNGHFQEMS